MNYKIYTKGNYIHIESVETGELFSGAKKDVEVDPNNKKRAEYRFFNIRDWAENNSLKIERIKKENGSQYTLSEWETFYTENTATYSGNGSSGTPTTFITAILPLQTPTGELVYMQSLSDGTTIYLNVDGTPYTGDITLLSPYSNSLIEFEVNMSLPANSDTIYDITPLGSEIRDYQVFDLSNPSQDISGQVSGAGTTSNQLRLYTTIAIPQLQIKGTRTKV